MLKITPTEEINKYWDIFSHYYTSELEGNVSHGCLSLLNMLKFWEAESVLEVGCGACLLLPAVISYKNKRGTYTMSDLSEKMLLYLKRRIETYNKNVSLCEVEVSEEEKFMPESFPEYGLNLQRENAEKLTLASETVDLYVSNLTLQIVENPENMIKEAFRVLRPGGKVGVSVWGSKEKSKFFDIIPEMFKKNNMPLEEPEVPTRSHFHLNDRAKLEDLFRGAGFKNILTWSQFSPFNKYTKADFKKRLEGFALSKKMLESLPAEESEKLKEKIAGEIYEELRSSGQPLGLEILFLIAEK